MSSQVTLEEHKLWAIFHQTYDSINRCKQNTSQKSPITNQQLEILWAIKFINEATDKPCVVTQLIPYLNRSAASISSMIFRLEGKGLLKTSRDLPDRRLIHIKITAKGLKLFSKAVKPNRDLIKKLLAVFSKNEIAILTRLLNKLKNTAYEECHMTSDIKNPAIDDDQKIIRFLSDEGNR